MIKLIVSHNSFCQIRIGREEVMGSVPKSKAATANNGDLSSVTELGFAFAPPQTKDESKRSDCSAAAAAASPRSTYSHPLKKRIFWIGGGAAVAFILVIWFVIDHMGNRKSTSLMSSEVTIFGLFVRPIQNLILNQFRIGRN